MRTDWFIFSIFLGLVSGIILRQLDVDMKTFWIANITIALVGNAIYGYATREKYQDD